MPTTSDEENAFGARTGAVDEELFSILKDLRKKISKQKDVPPFVIFQDPSLGRHGNPVSH